MKMSEEMAVRLHRMMWSDMQRELGDTPDASDRNRFKEKWCETHFPGEYIHFNCFLCDYCGHDYSNNGCDKCPIEWPDGVCSRAFGLPPVKVDYRFAPISEILALPTRNKELVTGYVVNDEAALARSYYEYREQLLSKASGIPASSAIEDHVKAIQEKAVQQSDFSKMYCDAKMELAKASGLQESDTINDHIAQIRKKEDRSVMQVLENVSGLKGNGLWVIDHVKKIQEKAVDDYFAKMPLAKAMTTDIDEAFKQHAEEQKAPIFRALAEASGLSAGNESVKAHISEISNKAKQNGRLERSEELFKALSVYSGVSKDDWRLQDHVEAIQIKERENLQPLREANGHMSSLITKYKDRLSDTSGLDRNRPVDDHVRAIFNNGFEAGKESARDLLLNKIEEILGQ